MAFLDNRVYATVTLTCHEADGLVVLLDGQGKRFAAIPKSLAHEVTEERIAAIEHFRAWSIAANGWIGSFRMKCDRGSRSDWDRKASMWLGSIRMRRNRTRPLRIRATDRQDSRWHRKNWDEAIRLLRTQYFSSLRKEHLRRENPWILWAETVAANLKTRGSRHATRPPAKISIVSHKDGIASKARGAAVQMRIEW